MRVLTNRQMKYVEECANASGIEFIRLMENAGAACARIIKEKLSSESYNLKRITIISGSGKNGGDGFVITRKLYEAGCSVKLILACGPPRDSDALLMFNKLKALPVQIVDYIFDKSRAVENISSSDIVVDAVFGSGYQGSPDENLSGLFSAVNSSNCCVFSIDLPSGIECDTGEVNGENINADYTIAISSLKPAHILVPGALCCGNIIRADIGIPESCYLNLDEGGFYTLDDHEIKQTFAPISPFAHKGTFGRVLCICGSLNMPGAAVLAAKGAVYSGAGLVTMAFPDCAYAAIGARAVEQLLLPLNSNSQGTLSASAVPKLIEAVKKSNAVLIGCGLGLNTDTTEIVSEVIANSDCPLIIDADGITAVANNIKCIKKSKSPVIITPHPGEMSKLTGLSIADIQTHRINVAKDFSEESGAIIVLKGANTVVAEPGKKNIYVNSTGNPGLATAGSGDLLAGIMVSFIAQGLSPAAAARVAVHIHGSIGDIAVKKLSIRGLTPSACLEELPYAMKKYEQ